MAERDELEILLHLGEGEPGYETDGLDRGIPRPLELGDQAEQFLLGGGPIEATNLDVDRMDLTTANHRHNGVSRLLQAQAEFNNVLVIRRHVDRALVAEKVRCMQQEHMEDVTLDPLPAIQQTPQRTQLSGHRRAEGVLHCMDRAHLIRNRADTADARSDVGGFGEGSPFHERLVEPWRFEDAEVDILDYPIDHLDVHLALALDAGEVVDVDLSDI